MLSVKSRESKSFGKSYLKSIGYIALFSFIPAICEAQESASTTPVVTEMGTILSISLSLLVVLGVIFALAYLMRRFTVTASGNGQMKVVASMMAGAKERIMVLQVGEEQHLIGITPQQISHLSTLATPIESAASSFSSGSQTGFKQQLVEAMASRMKGTARTKEQSSNE